MKNLKLKLVISLVVAGTFFAGDNKAHAAGCEPQEPGDYFICDGVGDTPVDSIATCEQPTRTTDGAAGCYDTDGDCIGDTFYNARVVEAFCTSKEGVRRKCTAVGYNSVGNCPNV